MIDESFERIGKRCDAVIFDLDGTLVDTAPDILAHLNDMLAEFGRPGLDLEEVRPMIGDGARRLLAAGLEASGGVPEGMDIDGLFHRYLQRYTTDPARLSRPYAGVVEVLEALSSAGIKMGVCTNKPQAASERVLADLGLDRHFDVVIGGDALAVRKPNPNHLLAVLERMNVAPRRAVLVGDSANDADTASTSGIPCILVSFGYTATPARDLGADRVIDHFADLISSLDDLANP